MSHIGSLKKQVNNPIWTVIPGADRHCAAPAF